MAPDRYGELPPLASENGPYSKGVLARALVAAGVPVESAYRVAHRVEIDLAERGQASTGPDRLMLLAQEVLGEDEGARAANRLSRLADLQSIDMPLIVLIGGSTGTGKSTVAVELARRLGITRVASTDLIRQTMRAFFSPEFMPSIHYSSFEAGAAVGDEVTGDPTIAGFVDQCRHVCVGADAAIRRAITEGWSMILEGVHLVPGLLPAEFEGALVVPVVIEVREEEIHRLNFHVRDLATGGLRGVTKYTDRLDEIRRIQSYITARARRDEVPVVDNVNVDRTIVQVLEMIMDAAEGSAADHRGNGRALSPNG